MGYAIDEKCLKKSQKLNDLWLYLWLYRYFEGPTGQPANPKYHRNSDGFYREEHRRSGTSAGCCFSPQPVEELWSEETFHLLDGINCWTWKSEAKNMWMLIC